MNQPSNQLKLGAVLSYVSTGLNMAVQLLYTPLMIRLLGQSEYGLYTLVGSVVSYLSLFSLGFTGAYLRFYSQRKAKNDTVGIARLNGMFLSVFLLMSLAAFVCGMVLLQFPRTLFGSKLTAAELNTAKVLMAILVVNIALTFPAGLLESMVTAHEKFLFQQLVTLASVVFNPLLCLPLLLMGFGSVAVVSVTTILTVAKLAVSAWYCVKKLRMRITFGRFDFGLLRDMAGFSFFIFLNEIINQINWTVDTTLLGIISGTAATAIYGVGAQINQYYMALSTSISGVFTPQINRIVARGEGDEQLTRLFTRVGRIQFMLLMLVLTGFIFVGMPFIQAWGGAEYAPAYWVALLLIGPVTVPLIQNIGIEIQRAKNMHQFRSKVYFCMAIGNAIVSVPLGMKFGGIGCALGTAISMIVGNGFIMNWYYQTHIGLDMVYFWKRILGIVPAMLPAIALGVAAVRLHTFTGYSGVLTFAVPYAAVYAAGLYRFAMDESERDMVRSVVRKIRR